MIGGVLKCLWISSQAKKSVFGRPRFYTTKNFVKLSPEVPHNGKRRHAFRPKDACASVGCASMVLSLNKKVKWGGMETVYIIGTECYHHIF